MTTEPLIAFDRGFNAAVIHFSQFLWPMGYDVTSDELVVPSDMSISQFTHTYYHSRGNRLLVSSAHGNHTIFGDIEVNTAFRAWHDWCHIARCADFTLTGETHVAITQCQQLITLYGRQKSLPWRRILWAEVVGQAEHFTKTGQFPEDQVTFDRDYLANQLHPVPFY